MKIEVELPNSVIDKVIYVITEDELIAVKKPDTKWIVKKTSCNKCGKCCYDLSGRHPFRRSNDGRCAFLVAKTTDDGGIVEVCSLGEWRPTACLIGHHEIDDKKRDQREFVIKCTEEFEEA